MGGLRRGPEEPGAADEIGGLMSSQETAELLAEMRAMRNEIQEIKLALAEQKGQALDRKVIDLEKRVAKLELWRSLLIGSTTAAGASALGALLKMFGA